MHRLLIRRCRGRAQCLCHRPRRGRLVEYCNLLYTPNMKRVAALVALLLAMASAPITALAATYVQDNGNMFSSGAKNQASQLIDNIVRRTGKEVLVYTVPSL